MRKASRTDEAPPSVRTEKAQAAFGRARSKPVICFAHVTNQMGSVEGDFEKGEEDGSRTALQLIAATAKAWYSGKTAL